MAKLEDEFDGEMLLIYKRAKKECRYNATRFLQMLEDSLKVPFGPQKALFKPDSTAIIYSSLNYFNPLPWSDPECSVQTGGCSIWPYLFLNCVWCPRN